MARRSKYGPINSKRVEAFEAYIEKGYPVEKAAAIANAGVTKAERKRMAKKSANERARDARLKRF